MTQLPIGWRLVQLGALAEVIQGQSPDGKSYNADGHGLPFFQGKAEFGDLHPTVRKWTTAPSKVSEAGDILLSVRAPVGPTNLAPVQCCIGRGLAAIRAKPGTDQRYLLHFLRWYEPELAAHATGTTFGAVSGSQIREIEVPLPALDEQRAIVMAIEKLLSRSDAAGASLRRIRQRIAAARSSLLAGVVSGGLLPSRVSPDHWYLARVSDLVERLQYGTSSKTSKDSAGVPVLRMGNIRDGRIDYTDLKYLPADHSDLANTLLKPGDILFNRTNSPELVGKCAVFSGHAGRFSFASYLVRLSPLPQVNPTWLAAAINSPLGREYIASVRVQQVGQANVSAKKIGAMQIRVPPRELQDTLAAELERQIEGLDLVSRAVDTNLARGARLRQSILAFAFTGRLVRAEVAAQTGEMPHAGIVPLPTGLAS